jgi:hypothetical protein
MQFLLMFYGDESAWAKMPPEQQQQSFAAFMQYNKDLAMSGKLKSAAQLMPTQAAKTVRVRNGKAITTDGPFAETREQIGGYYLLEVANEAEALAWAAKCPAAFGGSLEVRPVMLNPT